MTTFSSFSFRIIKISPYIIFFKKSLAGFWRPPPGADAPLRGQMPPLPSLATPLPVMYALVSLSGKKIR